MTEPSDSRQPDFRHGVIYSRGPLVRGILRGVWAPSLIVLLLMGGYVWYRYSTEASKTILDVAAKMETHDRRARWLAAFELTKRLRAEQPDEYKRALYERLKVWISKPELFSDEMLMRYVAIVAGLLDVDHAIPVSKHLMHHASEVVRLSAYSVFMQQPGFIKNNWAEIANGLRDTSDNVKALVLRILEGADGVPASIRAQVTAFEASSGLDLRWNALLVGFYWDAPTHAPSLKELLKTTINERKLEEFHWRTINVLEKNYTHDTHAFFMELYAVAKNMKIKRALEDIVKKHSGV